ncbi:MAG: hypothetical protein KGJ34_02990 [Patescibacteria group bacterium]|nr:hypothetical protein [Patescibacteria group bacterium]
MQRVESEPEIRHRLQGELIPAILTKDGWNSESFNILSIHFDRLVGVLRNQCDQERLLAAMTEYFLLIQYVRLYFYNNSLGGSHVAKEFARRVKSEMAAFSKRASRLKLGKAHRDDLLFLRIHSIDITQGYLRPEARH